MKKIKNWIKTKHPLLFKILKKIKNSLKNKHPKFYKKIRKILLKLLALTQSAVKKTNKKGLDNKQSLEALKKESPYYNTAIKIFEDNRYTQKQMGSKTYEHEFYKYLKYLQTMPNKDVVLAQMTAFLTSDFILKSNKLRLSENPLDPVVFVVVRNELERMKVFFDHYRKLGVHQFVVLDNDSDDGTLEFLCAQKGTKVYQIKEKYQTQKKEGWIEKLLALNGLNRWCVVVDSDELLDYIGREEHTLNEVIQKCVEKGYKRLFGYMVDMYSENPLFADRENNSNLCETYKYFDKEGYFIERAMPPSRALRIYGGARYRLFKVRQELSKQSVFYCDQDLYCRSAHTFFPVVAWGEVPCWFVLRHYKFISTDKTEYERRIKEECFWNGSQEYKDMMNQINEKGSLNMFWEGSVEYKNSASLSFLPFIKKIDWNNPVIKKKVHKSIMLQGYLHDANFGDILSGYVFYKRCLKAGYKTVDFYQNGDYGIQDFCRRQTGYRTIKSQKECLKSDALVIISGGSFWNNGKDKLDADIRYERFILPALEYQKQGKPVYILGVGGGPVDTPWLREKMVEVLNKAKVVTFRDAATKRIFEEYGVTNKTAATADTMLIIKPEMLEPFEEKYQLNLAANGKKKILLHIPDGRWANSCIVDLILPSLIRFLKEHSDYFLVLSNDNVRPMPKEEKEQIQIIRNQLTENNIPFYDYKYYDSWQMCSLLNEMDCIVTLKLHVGVVGCSLGKSVVSFPVHREKTDNFYKMIDQSARCVNVRKLNVEKAYEQLNLFYNKPVHISEELRAAAEENLSVLDNL